VAVAFVQAASNTGTSTVTVTLGSPTTAGNCLVACIAMGNASGTASVASVKLGGAADNWSQLKAVGDLAVGAEQLAVWADPSCAGGQTAVAVTLNVALVSLVWVFEFSGVAASAVLDQSATFDSAGGTNSTFSVTSGATTQASEVAVGCVYGFNTTITGPSSPWVNEATITSTTRTLQAGYDILSSTGTVTYSGSFGAAAFNGQILVTLFGAVTASQPSAAPGQTWLRQFRHRQLALGVPSPSPPPLASQVPQAFPGQTWLRQFWHRQVLFTPQPAGAAPANPAGSVQPWPTVPVPRRVLARARWAGSSPFLGFVAVPAPLQGPYLPPRRKPARGVWGGLAGQAYVAVPAPKQEPPVPRRRPARGIWGGVTGSARVAVPAPRQSPYLPPRRVPGRAWWRGSSPFLGFVAVPVPPQQPVPAPRRKPARAVVEFTPVTTTNAAAAQIPAPPQQPGPAPRRVPGRAYVRFTPVTTTNAVAQISGTPQPWPTVPVPRRQPSRAVWHQGTGSAYVAVPAPRQGPYRPPRRALARVTWRGGAGQAYVAVPAPRQPAQFPRRRPSRAVVQFRPVRTTNRTTVTVARGMTVGPDDGKTWWKKRWILRL